MEYSNGKGLDSLPDELLLYIFEVLAVGPGGAWAPEMLHPTTLTSRRLKGLAETIMYSRYSLENKRPEMFLATLAKYPEKACRLKAVSFTHQVTLYTHLSNAYESCSETRMGHDAYQRLKSNVNFLIQRGKELTSSSLWEFDETCLSTFLLLAERSEKLEVDAWTADIHVRWFGPIVYATPHPFEHLKEVIIMGPMRFENAASIIVLPSLRTLDLTEVVYLYRKPGYAFEWDGEKSACLSSLLTEKGSKIEHLHFRKSYLHVRELMELLYALPGLQSFTYDHHPWHDTVEHEMEIEEAEGWATGLEYVTFAHLLSRHSHSLKSLRMWNTEPLVEDKEDIGDITSVLATLTNSPSLRTVEWSDHDFPDPTGSQLVDVLPRTLWHLKLGTNLSRTHPDYNHNLEVWVQHAETFDRNLYAIIDAVETGRFPELKSVEVCDWHRWWGYYPPSTGDIKKKFNNLGVHFSSVPAEALYSLGWLNDKEVFVKRERVPREPGWLFVERGSPFRDPDHAYSWRPSGARVVGGGLGLSGWGR